MAAHSSSKASPTAILGKIPGPCHTPSNWLLPELSNNHDAVFASTVIDVARGVGVIVSILDAHIIDLNARVDGAGDSIRPLLSESDTSTLARLAAFSLEELYGQADGRVNAMNAAAAAGARP